MRAEFEVQPVRSGDLVRLERADPRLITDTARRKHIGDLLALGMSWAALDAGEVAGFVIGSRHFFNFPFVDLIVVAESERRRGVGAALMAHCEAMHDSDRIFTSTNESNAPMRALLAKAGWLPAGVVHYLDPGDPELMFVKLRA